VFASFMPAYAIPETVEQMEGGVGSIVLVGAVIASLVYIGIVSAIHASIKKTFMMTVRRLAGTR